MRRDFARAVVIPGGEATVLLQSRGKNTKHPSLLGEEMGEGPKST